MCGIAGIFAYAEDAPQVDAAELLRMRDRMITRGPDGAGMWVAEDRYVGLAHRRLAIVDLSIAGAQPMASRDGHYRIVFNGEIYNFKELREELRQAGAVFESNSDTEVLVQLYAREGGAMCRRLRGMYALAIWDDIEKCLFMARDPFGIKPLYIHDDGRSLRLASQVKGLLAGGTIGRDADPEGERAYWIWGHVPEPRTLYRGIRALTPGTWVKVHRGGQRRTEVFESVANLIAGFDRLQSPDGVPNDREITLRDVLLDSVRHHLIADVPVCVFLSSGIDSATLAALAAECGTALRTVTVGFEEYRGTASDETVLAEQVARRYGADHQTVWIGRHEFEDSFDAFVDSMDQPTIDGLNTWLVARAASQLGHKVALSGLGGDEFFGGYPSFHQIPWIRRLSGPFAAIPGLGAIIRRAGVPLLRRFTSEKYAGLLEYGATWEGAYTLRRALRMPWETPGEEWTQELKPVPELEGLRHPDAIVSFLEATYYMRNQLLRDSDWAGMAHSLEVRVPLIDVHLTRHVAMHRREGRSYSKRDLAAVARPPLPSEIVRRPKTGFTVPVREWMRTPISGVGSTRGLRGWQEAIGSRFIGA